VSNAFAIADALALRPNDTGVSWLPLFHDMGLVGALLTAVCHPYPLHLMSPEAFVMRPERWLSVASRVRASLTVAPNFAFDLCVQRAQLDTGARLDGLRLVLNGSEPVETSTAERFASQYGTHGFRATSMLPVYGMAENTLAVSFAKSGDGVRAMHLDHDALERQRRVVPSVASDAVRVVSVGRPVAGTWVSVRNERGAIVPEDTIAEIWIAGASRMEGYFRRDDANAECVRDGWYRTGDLGFVHDGELYVVGRSDDVIIKGGRNVYPHDLERVASGVRGVRRGGLAAFGRRNAEAGTDDVVIVAETLERDEAERARIVREIRGEVLAVLGIKVDVVQLVPAGAIPRTTSGKAQRRACVQLVAREEDPA
jgi:acyl-CoA synthetase (AMP-forming)/AMP-acid ligase II